MLDIFLNVAHAHEEKQAQSLDLAKALEHLPEEELRELVRTGDIKLASDWLAQFKGTEHYAKAIELEAESLQKEASVETRVKQRLLEVKLAGFGQDLLTGVDKKLRTVEEVATALRHGPRGEALGYMAPGLLGTAAVGGIAYNRGKNKTERENRAKKNAETNKGKKKTAMPSAVTQKLQSSAPSKVKMTLKPGDAKLMANQIQRTTPAHQRTFAVEKDPFAKTASSGWADEVGRIFARNDMEKQALSAQAITTLGGAALGGLHGMFREGGGLGSGLVEGAGGAALGAGAHHLGTKALAHKEYGPKLTALKDRAMSYVKKVPGEAPPINKTGEALNYELRKEAFGAALAQIGKAAIPAITGFIKKNPLKAAMGAAQVVGGGIQSKAQGGSFLGGAAGGALGAAGTLAT